MVTENSVLMRQAREALAGKWRMAMGTFVVYFLVIIAISGNRGGGSLAVLLASGPLMLGMAMFSTSLSRNKNPRLEQLFLGFNRFGQTLSAYILMAVFTFLWMLLFIIPGIVAAISYSQVFYILVDDENISAKEALKKSKRMMYGYKWKYFRLGLRFFGWGILSILSLGVGFLWLIPYIHVTMAKFYDDISDKPILKEVV